jgi:hypothetical protein
MLSSQFNILTSPLLWKFFGGQNCMKNIFPVTSGVPLAMALSTGITKQFTNKFLLKTSYLLCVFHRQLNCNQQLSMWVLLIKQWLLSDVEMPANQSKYQIKAEMLVCPSILPSIAYLLYNVYNVISRYTLWLPTQGTHYGCPHIKSYRDYEWPLCWCVQRTYCTFYTLLHTWICLFGKLFDSAVNIF